MTGGTDHDIDPDEVHYAARLLSRERAEDLADLVYDVRARFQAVPWIVVIGGLGSALTGLATHDTTLLCSGITAVVVAFIPRARPLWIYAVVQTVCMRRGWTAVPAEERPLRSPDEIVAERARPVAEVRRADEA